MRKRTTLFLIAVLLVSTAVLVGWRLLKPIEVEALAREKEARVQVYVLGTMEVHTLSNIGFKVSGTLARLSADHGDRGSGGRIPAVGLSSGRSQKTGPSGEPFGR